MVVSNFRIKPEMNHVPPEQSHSMVTGSADYRNYNPRGGGRARFNSEQLSAPGVGVVSDTTNRSPVSTMPRSTPMLPCAHPTETMAKPWSLNGAKIPTSSGDAHSKN